MYNIVRLLSILLVCTIQISFANDKVAIVVPMEHRAMNDIDRGVKDNLKGTIDNDKVVVFNAMGDINNMNSIMNQIANNPTYDAILPIGTNATYLALSTTKNKNIVSLASTIDEETRQKLIADGYVNITNVYDEVTADSILQFITCYIVFNSASNSI